jgi:spermidine synthase
LAWSGFCASADPVYCTGLFRSQAKVTAMIPWERLDAVTLEDGIELKLMRRGSEYSIMLGTNELMNSRLSGSEEALANLAAGKLQGRREPRLLIGGLGMGFTLRAGLKALWARMQA